MHVLSRVARVRAQYWCVTQKLWMLARQLCAAASVVFGNAAKRLVASRASRHPALRFLHGRFV